MAVQIIVNMSIKDGSHDLFMDYISWALGETRGAKGAHYLDLGVDQDDPNHFALIEKWDSRQDYEDHSSKHVDQPERLQRVAEIFAAAPTVHVFDLPDI